MVEMEIPVQTIELMMKSFYDFYGRVIIYDLKMLGTI
jgi:hypothetical protein